MYKACRPGGREQFCRHHGLQALTKLEPDNSNAWCTILSGARFNSGYFEESLNAIAKAMEIEPGIQITKTLESLTLKAVKFRNGYLKSMNFNPIHWNIYSDYIILCEKCIYAKSKQFNREKVLEVAANIFRQNGYNGTSIDDILKATGLSRSSSTILSATSNSLCTGLLWNFG